MRVPALAQLSAPPSRRRAAPSHPPPPTLSKRVRWSQTTKTPAVSYFIKKAAGLESGSGRAGHESLGTISLKHIYEIAAIKQTDPLRQFISLESHCKEIIGTCRSMGVRVLGLEESDALAAAEGGGAGGAAAAGPAAAVPIAAGGKGEGPGGGAGSAKKK